MQRKKMEQNLETLALLVSEKRSNEISLIMLHSTLGFLMTRFIKRQCPKLALLIVRHIRLIIAHPEMTAFPSSKTLYLELFEQWLIITATLLEPGNNDTLSNTPVKNTGYG